MTLPLLLSVPHAGLLVPPEVEEICILSEAEIIRDGDEGAAHIYLPLEREVKTVVFTDVARAVLDMNRPVIDRSKDGIVKTHTCWDVPVYSAPPSEELVASLIDRYHAPYHARLSEFPDSVVLGVDCHTMAAKAPPVAPDPNAKRPFACLSNAGFTCPEEWIVSLAEIFDRVFDAEAGINSPFEGGYSIRSHAKELPWVQLELTRAPLCTNDEKRSRVSEALKEWCEKWA